MSTVVFSAGVEASAFAGNALKAAARLWFVVAVTGQMMLATYVAWFYGTTALRGRVDAWGHVLSQGYVRGDAPGNLAVITHLLAAVLLTAGGAILLTPQVRERVPALHRWTGRLYLLTACAAALSGLYMTWIRGTRGDFAQHVGGSLNAVLIIACAALALRSAMTRRFVSHRRWVLRLFMVVSGAWFYRVGLFLWLLLNDGRPVGFDLSTFRGPALTLISFANSIIPLAVLELYLHAQTRYSAPGRIAVATTVFALTVAMGIGVFGATIGMWLPIIRTGYLRF